MASSELAKELLKAAKAEGFNFIEWRKNARVKQKPKPRSPWTDIQKRAVQSVSVAVRKGALINLRREVVKCMDCDARATCYDHRDYREPLAVEPVCSKCNNRRGSAEQVPGVSRYAR